MVTGISHKIVFNILTKIYICRKLLDDFGQVCLNSMHSVNRLHRFYPNITLLDLNAFYGHFRKLENMTKFEWNKFISSGKMATSNLTDLYPNWADINSIVTGSHFMARGSSFCYLYSLTEKSLTLKKDLADFYRKTRPVYILKGCYFNSYDCRRDWKIVQLLSGNCLLRGFYWTKFCIYSNLSERSSKALLKANEYNESFPA